MKGNYGIKKLYGGAGREYGGGGRICQVFITQPTKQCWTQEKKRVCIILKFINVQIKFIISIYYSLLFVS